MTKDEALKRAFDWYGSGNEDPDEFEKLILSIVAQPEQEPVACRVCGDERGSWAWQCNHCGAFDESPQPRKPLTDEEIWDAYMEIPADFVCNMVDLVDFARAIEAAHGIKGEA